MSEGYEVPTELPGENFLLMTYQVHYSAYHIYLARSCCYTTPVWMPDASYFEGVRRRDRGPGLYRDEECPHCGGPGSPAGSALGGDHPVDARLLR